MKKEEEERNKKEKRKKNIEREKDNKGPGARAGHFPSFFSLFCNAKNPFVSTVFFSRFEIRGLFVELSPESQLIRSGLNPFRINPK